MKYQIDYINYYWNVVLQALIVCWAPIMDTSTFVYANNGRNVINLKIDYVIQEWHFHGEKDLIHRKNG